MAACSAMTARYTAFLRRLESAVLRSKHADGDSRGRRSRKRRLDGGVLGNDSKIYGIPCSASKVLCFDPDSQTATLVGDDPGSSGSKWLAAVKRDGKIYGIPNDASKVLCFDPNTQTATLVGDELGIGSRKWSGGVLGNDNKIYGIPCSASKVLCITWDAGDALLHAWEKGETPDYLLAAFSSYAQAGKLAAASVHVSEIAAERGASLQYEPDFGLRGLTPHDFAFWCQRMATQLGFEHLPYRLAVERLTVANLSLPQLLSQGEAQLLREGRHAGSEAADAQLRVFHTTAVELRFRHAVQAQLFESHLQMRPWLELLSRSCGHVWHL